MTSEQARELFSAAYDRQLDEAEQRAFDAALANDAALAAEYASFRETMRALEREAQLPDLPAPDLLKGVQRRLRNKSGGRFYADRFAERSGLGAWQPLTLLGVLLALLVLALCAYALLHSVQIAR